MRARISGPRIEPEKAPVLLVMDLGDADPPGREQPQGQGRRQDGEAERLAQEPPPPAPAGPAPPREDGPEPGRGQGRRGEGEALGLGEDRARQQEAGREAAGEARPGFQQERQGGAVEAGQRQVAVGAHRAAAVEEGRERQQGGGRHGPGHGGAPGSEAPRAAVDQQQPDGQERRVQGPEEGLVLPRPGHLLDGDLGDGHQQGVPREADEPAGLLDRTGVHRPLGAQVPGLGAPGHAAVPVRQGRVEGLGQGREGNHDGDGDRHPLPGGPRARAGIPLPAAQARDQPDEGGQRRRPRGWPAAAGARRGSGRGRRGCRRSRRSPAGSRRPAGGRAAGRASRGGPRRGRRRARRTGRRPRGPRRPHRGPSASSRNWRRNSSRSRKTGGSPPGTVRTTQRGPGGIAAATRAGSLRSSRGPR